MQEGIASFEDSLVKLKTAEEDAKRLVEEAARSKEAVVHEARKKAEQIADKAADEANALRERMIADGQREIEKEAKNIIAGAENEAAAMGNAAKARTKAVAKAVFEVFKKQL